MGQNIKNRKKPRTPKLLGARRRGIRLFFPLPNKPPPVSPCRGMPRRWRCGGAALPGTGGGGGDPGRGGPEGRTGAPTHPPQPRSAGASGQTPKRQHLALHLADKWSQRSLKGPGNLGVGGVGGALALCPASRGVRVPRGAAPTPGNPRCSPPPPPPWDQGWPGTPVGSGKGTEGLRSPGASLEGGVDPRQNSHPAKWLLLPLPLTPRAALPMRQRSAPAQKAKTTEARKPEIICY